MKIYVVEISILAGIQHVPYTSLPEAMEAERDFHGRAKIFVMTVLPGGADGPKIVSYEPWE